MCIYMEANGAESQVDKARYGAGKGKTCNKGGNPAASNSRAGARPVLNGEVAISTFHLSLSRSWSSRDVASLILVMKLGQTTARYRYRGIGCMFTGHWPIHNSTTRGGTTGTSVGVGVECAYFSFSTHFPPSGLVIGTRRDFQSLSCAVRAVKHDKRRWQTELVLRKH